MTKKVKNILLLENTLKSQLALNSNWEREIVKVYIRMIPWHLTVYQSPKVAQEDIESLYQDLKNGIGGDGLTHVRNLAVYFDTDRRWDPVTPELSAALGYPGYKLSDPPDTRMPAAMAHPSFMTQRCLGLTKLDIYLTPKTLLVRLNWRDIKLRTVDELSTQLALDSVFNLPRLRELTIRTQRSVSYWKTISGQPRHEITIYDMWANVTPYLQRGFGLPGTDRICVELVRPWRLEKPIPPNYLRL